jgi:hypothetical protein
MSRSTTARHSKRFFCAYGDHGAPIDKRTERRGVIVCAACKAHFDSLDAANDSELDAYVPAEAFNEALAELVDSLKVLSLSCPTELETISALTVSLAQVERLRAVMHEKSREWSDGNELVVGQGRRDLSELALESLAKWVDER